MPPGPASQRSCLLTTASSLCPSWCAGLEPVLREAAPEYELILVDDGSHDHTWQVIEQLVREHDWITGVHLMRNYGQHNALLCGIRLALSLIHISEPTRLGMISYAVF